ncbi:DUF2516 family protein [Spongisporangium articulatum]|uniref:DUF2516 family protein n=1 Tax=Spongisporangium articulatum TaxID=3362603 RepID=A0ABW8AJS5_9ACTN
MVAAFTVQWVLLLALAGAAFGVEVFAFVDALRTRVDAFTATGKLTKNKWLLITGVATVIGLIFLIAQLGSADMFVFNIVNIIAFVAAAVYMVDVRPAVRSISGGGSSGGPYGGW